MQYIVRECRHTRQNENKRYQEGKMKESRFVVNTRHNGPIVPVDSGGGHCVKDANT